MRHLRRAALAAVLMLLSAGPAAAHASTQLGAFANEPGGITALQQELGRTLSIDHMYVPWTYATWQKRVQPDIAAGRTPLFSWSAAPATTAADIASGSQDATITAAATALRAVGATVYLRPFYEFDQPVGHPRYIGAPADVVLAWQHTIDIFRAVGATNVKFVWCPMAFDYSNEVAVKYWPGASYVDYVGADGYDFPGSTWVTFARIFAAAYKYSVAQARPLFIAETAATATDPRAPSWITGAEAWAQSHPNLAAVVYFDSISPKGCDFRLYANQPAHAAFRVRALNPCCG
jgi:beta-mannanase